MKESPPFQSFVSLLGKRWGSMEVDSTINQLSEETDISRSEQLAFWECPAKGISIALEDELYVNSGQKKFLKDGPLIVVAVHFYSSGYDGYRPYTGTLPIKIGDSKGNVRIKLGEPTKSGGGNEALGKIWPFWDRYLFKDYSMRAQYDSNGNVDVVTITWPASIPGRHQK